MAERKIAGMEIKVDAPLATDALRLQARLTRMLEAADAKLEDLILGFSGAGNTPEERAKGIAAAISTIGRIFRTLSPDEYASLVGDIIGMAQIRRPSGQYDQADLDGDFSQNLKAIPEVVVFVIDVVLRDFFTGLLGSGNRLRKAKV